MGQNNVIMIGAGGIGVVALEVLQANSANVQYCFDDRPEACELVGVEVRPSDDLAGKLKNIRQSSELLICIGNCLVREELAKRHPGAWCTTIHTSVSLSTSATVGMGTMIFHRSIVQARTRIGNHVIVNTGASIDHDCKIGNFVHIGPGSTLCGFVEVGDGANLGASTTIIPSVKIGQGAVIGAGAVVVSDIPPKSLAVGVPARVIKKL